MKSININERNFMLIPISKNIPELIYNIKHTLTDFVMLSDKHIIITNNDNNNYLKQMSIYNNHFVILNTSNQLNYVNYCMKYMQMYNFDNKFKIIKYFIYLFLCDQNTLHSITMFKFMKKYNTIKLSIIYNDIYEKFMNKTYYNVFHVLLYKIYSAFNKGCEFVDSIEKMLYKSFVNYEKLIKTSYTLFCYDNKEGICDFNIFTKFIHKINIYNKSVLKRIFIIILVIPVILQNEHKKFHEEITMCASLLGVSETVLMSYNPVDICVNLYQELVICLMKFINLYLNDDIKMKTDNEHVNMIFMNMPNNKYNNNYNNINESIILKFIIEKINFYLKGNDKTEQTIQSKDNLSTLLNTINDYLQEEQDNSIFDYLKNKGNELNLLSYSHKALQNELSKEKVTKQCLFKDYFYKLCKSLVLSRYNQNQELPQFKTDIHKLLRHLYINNYYSNINSSSQSISLHSNKSIHLNKEQQSSLMSSVDLDTSDVSNFTINSSFVKDYTYRSIFGQTIKHMNNIDLLLQKYRKKYIYFKDGNINDEDILAFLNKHNIINQLTNARNKMKKEIKFLLLKLWKIFVKKHYVFFINYCKFKIKEKVVFIQRIQRKVRMFIRKIHLKEEMLNDSIINNSNISVKKGKKILKKKFKCNTNQKIKKLEIDNKLFAILNNNYKKIIEIKLITILFNLKRFINVSKYLTQRTKSLIRINAKAYGNIDKIKRIQLFVRERKRSLMYNKLDSMITKYFVSKLVLFSKDYSDLIKTVINLQLLQQMTTRYVSYKLSYEIKSFANCFHRIIILRNILIYLFTYQIIYGDKSAISIHFNNTLINSKTIHYDLLFNIKSHVWFSLKNYVKDYKRNRIQKYLLSKINFICYRKIKINANKFYYMYLMDEKIRNIFIKLYYLFDIQEFQYIQKQINCLLKLQKFMILHYRYKLLFNQIKYLCKYPSHIQNLLIFTYLIERNIKAIVIRKVISFGNWKLKEKIIFKFITKLNGYLNKIQSQNKKFIFNVLYFDYFIHQLSYKQHKKVIIYKTICYIEQIIFKHKLHALEKIQLYNHIHIQIIIYNKFRNICYSLYSRNINLQISRLPIFTNHLRSITYLQLLFISHYRYKIPYFQVITNQKSLLHYKHFFTIYNILQKYIINKFKLQFICNLKIFIKVHKLNKLHLTLKTLFHNHLLDYIKSFYKRYKKQLEKEIVSSLFIKLYYKSFSYTLSSFITFFNKLTSALIKINKCIKKIYLKYYGHLVIQTLINKTLCDSKNDSLFEGEQNAQRCLNQSWCLSDISVNIEKDCSFISPIKNKKSIGCLLNQQKNTVKIKKNTINYAKINYKEKDMNYILEQYDKELDLLINKAEKNINKINKINQSKRFALFK